MFLLYLYTNIYWCVFYNLFDAFNNWFKYFTLPNQSFKNDLFNYSKKTIKTGWPFFVFHKKTKNTDSWNQLTPRWSNLLKEIKSVMSKHRKTNVYSKIKMKIVSCFNCCFYYFYESLFILVRRFFCNLLHINMFVLSQNRKRALLSMCRLLAHYKPTVSVQY